MPELPEVETIARKLKVGREAESILGKTITAARVYWDKTIASPEAESFKRQIVGRKIIDVGRRGKYLVFTLDEGFMLIHLRMSGDVLVGLKNEALADHVRVVFTLDDTWQLAFNNPRKFGRVWLLPDIGATLSKLGPEPLDETFTAEEFWQRLSQRKRQIKPLLMDQGFIAGLGNIYTDEALNFAKIHPLTQANELTFSQAETLLKYIRIVLQEGIRRNGASIDWVYRGGDFQNHFRVYQRTGEACPTCGTLIERIVVGQRGTHFCPNCQKLPKET